MRSCSLTSSTGGLMPKITIYEDAQHELKRSLGGDTLSLLDDQDFQVFCLEGMDEHDAYEHIRRGGCMLCGKSLGEDTLILIDEQGILGMWCEGDCMKDMHAIAFLEELLTGMTERLLPENRQEE